MNKKFIIIIFLNFLQKLITLIKKLIMNKNNLIQFDNSENSIK